MYIHKEGYTTLLVTFIVLAIINIVVYRFAPAGWSWLPVLLLIISVIVFLFIVSFFRIPKRSFTTADNTIVAPADGKVVVIEEVVDNEYFKEKRLQISIFMSPVNVHRNTYPVSGEVVHKHYYKGKYLVAWHPKSSTDNESYSVVLKTVNGVEILVKQIAGALARRICNYAVTGSRVQQNQEMGFIKFGSRVDLLLPVGTPVKVALNEMVKSGVSIIATL